MLRDTGLKPSAVALDLGRERTLMYKWLSGASTPSSSYFPRIVEIVSRRASEGRKLILRNDLQDLVRRGSLPHDVRAAILSCNSVEELLSECLHLSVLQPLKPGADSPRWRTSRSPAAIVVGGLLAAVLGGILWNALNRLLGWDFFMGSPGQSLSGVQAIIWGTITLFPIPAAVVLLHRSEDRRRLLLPSLLFVAVGAVCAGAFYASGVREAIENLQLGYVLQETMLALFFALAMSVLPLLAVILASGRGKLAALPAIVLAVPTAAALLGFLLTLLIDRPVSEVIQLRGFAVAFALRLALFSSLYLVSGTPGSAHTFSNT